MADAERGHNGVLERVLAAAVAAAPTPAATTVTSTSKTGRARKAS